MTFAELQIEVATRATRSASGFTSTIKNVINSCLLHIGSSANWRVLRQTATFNTVTSYTTGSGAVTATNGSTAVTVVGATFITDDIRIGRLIKIGTDQRLYKIDQITGETTLVLNQNYRGTTISGTGTYKILPQEEYNLPVQVDHRSFLWHEEYQYPYQMAYVPDQKFWGAGISRNDESVPEIYRLWGNNDVIEQVLEPTVLTAVSSSTSDTNVTVTIFGTVSGYPDQESVAMNGTSSVATTKSFSKVDRVVKNSATVGRITVTGNSGNSTVAVLPVGNSNETIKYSKIQLYPLPDTAFPINVYYYKEVYKLVNDNDVHELGQAFDEAIILLSVAKIKAEQGQQEASNFFELYNREIKNLRNTNVDKIDYTPTLDRGGRGSSSARVHPVLGYNQLGPYFGPRVY